MEQKKIYYPWIDWMKVYGMYFIILGHFFPSYASYIYAFNVPLFFIVSGVLSKKEHSFKTFIIKSLYNLIIPVCIIMIIQYIGDIALNPNISFGTKSLMRFANAIIGMHGIHYSGGLGTCWFIYTLFLLKLSYQIFPKQILQVLLILLPVIAVLLIKNKIAPGNAILNATIAYPFFWFGTFLHRYLNTLNNINLCQKTFILACISLFMLIIIGRFNWTFYMYLNAYGRYLLLAIIGGIAGTYIVYIMSILSEHYFKTNKYLKLLSVGSIVILGFHYNFIDLVHLYEINTNDYNVILYSLIIMLLFIPINMFFEKYCPIIFGKRLHNSTGTIKSH